MLHVSPRICRTLINLLVADRGGCVIGDTSPELCENIMFAADFIQSVESVVVRVWYLWVKVLSELGGAAVANVIHAVSIIPSYRMKFRTIATSVVTELHLTGIVEHFEK